MDAVKGMRVEDLDLILWEDASRQVGGDERDDVFLMELLVCFYSEGIPRLKKLIEACLIYRKGGTWVKGDGVADRTIEATIKEEAHAIKGSAANIRLWRLAKAAENTELPCKALVLKDNAPAAERKSLLDKFCIDPCHEIKTIYKEFRDFVAFMEQDSRKMVDPSRNLDEELDASSLEQLGDISVAVFDAEFQDQAEFWAAPEPATAAAKQPSAVPPPLQSNAHNATVNMESSASAGASTSQTSPDTRQPSPRSALGPLPTNANANANAAAVGLAGGSSDSAQAIAAVGSAAAGAAARPGSGKTRTPRGSQTSASVAPFDPAQMDNVNVGDEGAKISARRQDSPRSSGSARSGGSTTSTAKAAAAAAPAKQHQPHPPQQQAHPEAPAVTN